MKKKSGTHLIGVIGTGSDDPVINSIAEEVGGLIARKGKILINGGLGGVMQWSAKGCKANLGVTVGILPGSDPNDANPYIDIPVATGLGELRNLLVIRAASVLISIGGGYGTLSEIALALKSSKPVIGIKTWDVSPEVIKAANAGEAVAKALKAIGAE